MKRVLMAIATTVALSGFTLLAGCDNDAGDRDGVDSAATIDVDSGAGGATEVSAEEKDYAFDGTITAINGDMVTITHEEIADYKPAGTTEFKLASPDMAAHAKQGDKMSFKVQVTGETALITKMENSGTGIIGDNDGDTSTPDLAPDAEDTTK
jgi:hypothetical protein